MVFFLIYALNEVVLGINNGNLYWIIFECRETVMWRNFNILCFLLERFDEKPRKTEKYLKRKINV